MIAEFWELVVETWEQGIRGIGIDDILICLGIVLVSLIARSLMNSIVLDLSLIHISEPTRPS